MQMRLEGELARQLAADSGLSYPDYLVLVALTDRPDGRMRLFELGRRARLGEEPAVPPRARMAGRGLVTKEKCGDDRRGAYVVITERRPPEIDAAAPGHVATVRRLFIDPLTPPARHHRRSRSGRARRASRNRLPATPPTDEGAADRQQSSRAVVHAGPRCHPARVAPGLAANRGGPIGATATRFADRAEMSWTTSIRRTPAETGRHDQMYSSAITPSRHLATVTMRPPPSNSPITHVHSPNPNAMGCDVI